MRIHAVLYRIRHLNSTLFLRTFVFFTSIFLVLYRCSLCVCLSRSCLWDNPTEQTLAALIPCLLHHGCYWIHVFHVENVLVLRSTQPIVVILFHQTKIEDFVLCAVCTSMLWWDCVSVSVWLLLMMARKLMTTVHFSRCRISKPKRLPQTSYWSFVVQLTYSFTSHMCARECVGVREKSLYYMAKWTLTRRRWKNCHVFSRQALFLFLFLSLFPFLSDSLVQSNFDNGLFFIPTWWQIYTIERNIYLERRR